MNTHATASFFFHPYYPLPELKKIVAGIKAEGYTFVSSLGAEVTTILNHVCRWARPTTVGPLGRKISQETGIITS